MATPSNPTTTEAYVKCPYCAEVIAGAAKKCKHCGEFLDDTLRQSRMPAPAVQQPQQTWNPGTAAVLSFVIPGAGQMYKGQIGSGILWLIGTVAGYCAFIVPGLIVHIACIYRAYSQAPRTVGLSWISICPICGKYNTGSTCKRCGIRLA